MNTDRNRQEAVDDPEPIVDRDPNTGLLDETDPRFTEWVQWHLSFPLTQEQLDKLRQRLEAYGDDVGLEELDRLVEPTRFDHQRLLHLAEAKFGTNSDLTLIGY